jgi:hypothetical protein
MRQKSLQGLAEKEVWYHLKIVQTSGKEEELKCQQLGPLKQIVEQIKDAKQ